MSEFIKAAVIGHPIGHSKSPLIHNHWIEKNGLSGSYEAIDIAPENLHTEIKRLITEEGYSGFNFTIPHKETIMEICDEIDPVAETIGAVNTVAVKDGRIIGMNTDSYGFLANIQSHAPDFDFSEGTAVILGAGGAARAVISGLMAALVPDIVLINRTREKAQKLVEEMDMHTGLLRVVDWEDREKALAHINLLVNTTSLGMKGQPELDLPLTHLPPSALVNDIVYAPLETQLIVNAKQNGNEAVTGIGMLLHQARPAFKEWFGVLPEVDQELEDLVLA